MIGLLSTKCISAHRSPIHHGQTPRGGHGTAPNFLGGTPLPPPTVSHRMLPRPTNWRWNHDCRRIHKSWVEEGQCGRGPTSWCQKHLPLSIPPLTPPQPTWTKITRTPSDTHRLLPSQLPDNNKMLGLHFSALRLHSAHTPQLTAIWHPILILQRATPYHPQ